MPQLLAALPLLLPLAGGLLLLVLDLFVVEKTDLGALAVLILACTAAVAAALWQQEAPLWPASVAASLAFDPLALFASVLLALGAALATMLLVGCRGERTPGELYALTLLAVFGATVLTRALDLLTFYLGLEIMSFSVYALIGFAARDRRAVEAATKYFMLGSFAAAWLLFGVALLYGATQSLSFAGIAAALQQGNADFRLTLCGMVLVVCAVAFKLGAAPFHMWAPDAYEGAPAPVGALMSTVTKSAAVIALLRLLLSSFRHAESADLRTGWPALLLPLAALSLLIGNLAAVRQRTLRRLLAYSSIAHMGSILLGMAAVAAVGESALRAVLFYLLAYSAASILSFGVLAWLAHATGAESLADLTGLGRRHPLLAIPGVVGFFSLLGLPPTAGFFAKYYIFLAAMAGGGMLSWLALLAILGSAIGAFYYLRILLTLFASGADQTSRSLAGEATAQGATPSRSLPSHNPWAATALGIASLAVLWMGVAPKAFLTWAERAARVLLG